MFKRLILFSLISQFLMLELMHGSHHLFLLKNYIKVFVIVMHIFLFDYFHIILKIFVHGKGKPIIFGSVLLLNYGKVSQDNIWFEIPKSFYIPNNF